MQDLTPREIVAELDRYIVGQEDAKRAVAVALRNRFRRRLLSPEMREEVIPKNILMIGPTGVGKTEIARRLASLAKAPFIKVEATKFTEVGYVGRDVESMIRDLTQTAVRMVEAERIAEVSAEAASRAVDRIVDILQPRHRDRAAKQDERSQTAALQQALGSIFGAPTPQAPREPEPSPTPEDTAHVERTERIRARLRQQVADGLRDDDKIDIEVETQPQPTMQFVPGPGMEDQGMDFAGAMSGLMGRGKKPRRVTIGEARTILAQEEARLLIDQDAVAREAVERTEQAGIVFVDEIDKIAGARGGSGPDVSREGVQRDLLPIIEGSTINTKQGPVRTDYILFIAAGAFTVSKPSDLIPELQGRLPIRVELRDLTQQDFVRILTEPRNALTRQYVELMATEGLSLSLTDDAIEMIASIAAQVNSQSENIGARRLHTVMERLLEEISFDAPDLAGRTIEITSVQVEERLAGIAGDNDLSRYIL